MFRTALKEHKLTHARHKPYRQWTGPAMFAPFRANR